MVLLLRKEKFGSSSQKTPKKDINDQLTIFNEAELEAYASVTEPISREVKGYVRNDKRTKREELIKDLPIREILCESASEDQYCIQCGTPLKPIGKETVREVLEYIPAKRQIVRYVRMAYECPKCKHTDRPYIQKALTDTIFTHESFPGIPKFCSKCHVTEVRE